MLSKLILRMHRGIPFSINTLLDYRRAPNQSFLSPSLTDRSHIRVSIYCNRFDPAIIFIHLAFCINLQARSKGFPHQQSEVFLTSKERSSIGSRKFPRRYSSSVKGNAKLSKWTTTWILSDFLDLAAGTIVYRFPRLVLLHHKKAIIQSRQLITPISKSNNS